MLQGQQAPTAVVLTVSVFIGLRQCEAPDHTTLVVRATVFSDAPSECDSGS